MPAILSATATESDVTSILCLLTSIYNAINDMLKNNVPLAMINSDKHTSQWEGQSVSSKELIVSKEGLES